MDLEGKNAIVTGGVDGIGRGIALELAREGANVAIGDVKASTETVDGRTPTTDRVRELGGESVYQRTDVTDDTDVRALVDATLDRFGGVDVLVNNAGIIPKETRGKTVETLPDDAWEEILDVNLTGMYRCAKRALSHLRDSDAGRVINIASQMGLVGVPEAPAYCASKGGVVNFTRQLAVDYADERVTCNAICPGFVETGTKRHRLEDEADRAYYESNTLLPFFGEPEDVGKAAAFLASDGARFMTGQCLVVDGGWTAR